MAEKPVVLVSPLDWGLGHASRLIPVIRLCIQKGCKVLIGGNGNSLELLKTAFPQLTCISIPAYSIKYYGKGFWLIISMIWQMPLFFLSIRKEHRRVREIIAENNVSLIISDNRYGLYSEKIYSIIITHQVSPVLPFVFGPAEYPLYLVIRRMIGRFDECWIPDFEGRENVSGQLSHRYKTPHNARFIGLLSRFHLSAEGPSFPDNTNYKLVIVLSGPQPALRRITFRLIKQARELQIKTLVAGGLQDDLSFNGGDSNVTFKKHVPADELYHLLRNAEFIVCRAGYSSLMDLVAINRTGLIIPTSGQTEQEYLARYHHSKGTFYAVNESVVDLKRDLHMMEGKTGRPALHNLSAQVSLDTLIQNVYDSHYR